MAAQPGNLRFKLCGFICFMDQRQINARDDLWVIELKLPWVVPPQVRCDAIISFEHITEFREHFAGIDVLTSFAKPASVSFVVVKPTIDDAELLNVEPVRVDLALGILNPFHVGFGAPIAQ